MTGSQDLDELASALYAEARHVAESAYAPYSKFRVGAAVRADDGRVFLGTNVENASFSLTICAERAAIAAAATAGARKLDSIAIHVEADQGEPCGACRQVMLEFGIEDVVFVSAGQPRRYRMSDLLPHAFDGAALQ